MSKIFGFLLGIAVALALPAGFGGLAAEGGIELSARELALAYGVGALVFWAVVSYFAGAAALGAALTFGAMIYAVHLIPNRMRNFLDDIPGVTTGMIEGIRQYTLNGLVPVLAVISLVYAIQLMVRAAQRRRQLRAEAALRQREQELAQQQDADGQYQSAAPYQAPTPYPASSSYAQGGDYPTSVDNRYDESYGASEDQTRHNQSSGYERTAQYPVTGTGSSSDHDETTQLPTESTGAHSTRSGADAATAEFPTSRPARDESSRAGGQQATDPRSAERPAPNQRTGSSELGGESARGGATAEQGGAGSEQRKASSQGTGSSQGEDGPSPAASSGPAQPPAGSPQQSRGGATQQPTNDGPRQPGLDQGQDRDQGREPGPGRDLGPRASAENPGQRPTAGFHQPGHYTEQPQQVGQQYRERMDNPDHHFTVEPESHPQAFLTNQFRIA